MNPDTAILENLLKSAKLQKILSHDFRAKLAFLITYTQIELLKKCNLDEETSKKVFKVESKARETLALLDTLIESHKLSTPITFVYSRNFKELVEFEKQAYGSNIFFFFNKPKSLIKFKKEISPSHLIIEHKSVNATNELLKTFDAYKEKIHLVSAEQVKLSEFDSMFKVVGSLKSPETLNDKSWKHSLEQFLSYTH